MSESRKSKPTRVISQPADASSSSARKWNRYASVVIALFATLLYVNTIPNDFVNDDVFVTGKNLLIQRGVEGIPEILTTPYASFKNLAFEYRPIVKVTYAIEYEFFGDNPHLSHLIQAIFYGICCATLFLTLSYLFPGYKRLLPFTIALLFAAHPIHSEVVASLKNRDELLSFFFSLLTIYWFVRGWRSHKVLGCFIALLFYALAFLSKASSMILILWIPLLVLYIRLPNRSRWMPVVFSGALIVTSMTLTVAINKFIILQSDTFSRAILFVENPAGEAGNFLSTCWLALESLWFYCVKMIMPHPLGWYYGYNMIPFDKPWSTTALLSILVHFALLVIAVRGFRHRAFYSLAILLYLTALAPFLNLVSVVPGIVGERFAFFASLGFCSCLAVIIMKVGRIDISGNDMKPGYSFVFSMIVILGLYSGKVISRNLDYRNNLTLNAKDIKYLDKSVVAHHAYGEELQKQFHESADRERDSWMLEKAIEQYKICCRLYEKNTFSYMRIGEILAADYGRPGEAMPYFRKALSLSPDDPQVQFGIAFCYGLEGKNDSAIIHYKKTMQLDSSFLIPRINISVLFSKMGMLDSAISYNQVLLDRDINSEIGNVNMGFFYKSKGDFLKAEFYFRKALAINSDRTDVINALAEIQNTPK